MSAREGHVDESQPGRNVGQNPPCGLEQGSEQRAMTVATYPRITHVIMMFAFEVALV